MDVVLRIRDLNISEEDKKIKINHYLYSENDNFKNDRNWKSYPVGGKEVRIYIEIS